MATKKHPEFALLAELLGGFGDVAKEHARIKEKRFDNEDDLYKALAAISLRQMMSQLDPLERERLNLEKERIGVSQAAINKPTEYERTLERYMALSPPPKVQPQPPLYPPSPQDQTVFPQSRAMGDIFNPYNPAGEKEAQASGLFKAAPQEESLLKDLLGRRLGLNKPDQLDPTTRLEIQNVLQRINQAWASIRSGKEDIDKEEIEKQLYNDYRMLKQLGAEEVIPAEILQTLE